MKQWVFPGAAIAVAAAAMIFSLVNRPPKIGYAETSVLMSQFSEAIKAQKEFQEKQKEWDKNLKLINDSLMEAMNQLKQDYEKAPKSRKEEMRKTLEKWNSDLSRYSQAVKAMSQDKERELMEPVLSKLNSFMKTWGDQHNFDMIFGTMTGGNILQADNAYNVTSALIEDLNAHYKDLPPGKIDSGTTKKVSVK